MKLLEIVLDEVKAGFLPYVIENNQPVFMFMTPSDPAYGGNKPQIAKGVVEPAEDTQTAAIREAEEELGLVLSNLKSATIKRVWKGTAAGDKDQYVMSIFMGEVFNQTDFVDAHFETGSIHWMTEKQFSKVGRSSQTHIVKMANSLILKNIKL